MKHTFTYISSTKLKSKVHVCINNSDSYCDLNIKNLSKVGSFEGKDICLNCLLLVSKTYGGSVSLHIELKFYFKQYSGGSLFLDSINDYLISGMRLSLKQYVTAIEIFRQGKFELLNFIYQTAFIKESQ